MRRKKKGAWPLHLIQLWTSALAVDTPAHAQADGAAADRLSDIIVTAQKIEQPLDTVPASVAVVGESELRSPNLAGMERLEGRIPGLAFQPFGQAGLNSPVMRGVTANFNAFSTSTLLLVDGVPTLTAQGFENGFLDLDRIEVLRGPQSTLYGRNAEAGVIAIYSRPMEGPLRASVTGEHGSRNRRYVLSIIVLTPGYQLFQAANNTAALADVPKDRRGTVSGLLSLSRNIGLIAGASGMGAVFAFGVGTDDFTHVAAGPIAMGMRLTFLLAGGMMVAAILIAFALRPSVARVER